ncbi:hypothetical protein GOP47_0028991 [Adiantum capillus-veneris]|nr:hypothetical protein GOP47_0028991 [Adiantum capillus-veneris]
MESGVKDANIMWVGDSIGGVQAAGGQGGLSTSGIAADKEDDELGIQMQAAMPNFLRKEGAACGVGSTGRGWR